MRFRHYYLFFLTATLSAGCLFSFRLFLLPTFSCVHLALVLEVRLWSAFWRLVVEKHGVVEPTSPEDLAPAANAFAASAFAR